MDDIKEDTKKYQLTEDMAQDQKYWMAKIMAGPPALHNEMVKTGEKTRDNYREA